MTSPTGGNQNIIIKIVADVKDFLKSVQGALNNAGKAASAFVSNIQSKVNPALQQTQKISQQFNQNVIQLTASLVKGEKQLATLSNSTLGWAKASQLAHTTQNKMKDTLSFINDAIVRYGVNMQKAAQIAIATGTSDVNTVQRVLKAQGQRILSVRQVEDALNRLGVNINRVAKGEQLLFDQVEKTNKALKEQSNQGTKTSGVMQFLGNRIRAIIASVAVAGAIYKFVDILKELAKTGPEISQSLFNFNAAIKANTAVFGLAAGSVAYWESRVKALRKELAIFSERDIRNAITQTINLTRNLNLGAESVDKILKIATVLAKTTGVDLNQAISDVTHAMTGSRVVLDKYGLNIRDGDLKARALAMGLTEATESMTSQEIALVTLNEILAQSNALIEATGDYNEELAGEVKKTEAEINDSKDQIASSLGELNLVFKNLYADFLQYVVQIVKQFQPLFDMLEKANELREQQIELDARVNAAPQTRDFGVTPGLDKTGRQVEKPLGEFDGVPYYLREQLSGTEEALDAYEKALDEWMKLTKQANDMAELANMPGRDRRPRAIGAATAPMELTPEDQEKLDDAGRQFQDLFDKRREDLEDAYYEFSYAVDQTYEDARRDVADAEQKFQDDLEKLKRDRDYDFADALTDYNRDLADIEADESDQIADAQRERDRKILDNKEKYYDALKALDREYYFELFDAVAANDAVAIKQAERKYNLDKAKLQDKLDDDNQTEEQNYQDRLERIRRETEERQRELALRYQRELEDIQKQYEREVKELNVKLAIEKREIKEHYEELRDELQEKYDKEKVIIDRETDRRFIQLQLDLADELQEYRDYIYDLLELWRDYYNDLDDITGSNGPGDVNDPNNCPPGFIWNAAINRCVPQQTAQSFDGVTSANAGISEFTANSNHIVTITSDGTVSDAIIESVAKELADTFETIIIASGGKVGPI